MELVKMMAASLEEAARTEGALEKLGATIDALPNVGAMLRQRAELAALLREALQLIEAEIDNRDGLDRFDMACGNCIAGAPMAHSFGCRAERALRAVSQ